MLEALIPQGFGRSSLSSEAFFLCVIENTAERLNLATRLGMTADLSLVVRLDLAT